MPQAICAKCNPSSWAQGKARRTQLFNEPYTIEQIRAEMSRPSAFRDEAERAGLLRPFLVLVSMDPATRAQLAVLLGPSASIRPLTDLCLPAISMPE